MNLNNRNAQTLRRIFTLPVVVDLRWAEVEALILALGGEISEGSGSRVRIALNGVRAVFHRPHPSPVAKRGAVRSVREFLVNAGVERSNARI